MHLMAEVRVLGRVSRSGGWIAMTVESKRTMTETLAPKMLPLMHLTLPRFIILVETWVMRRWISL